MGFGTGVRNEFGLRGDNQPLHDSCGTKDAEGCSSVILNRLWESVRGDANPVLVHQLDCQFQLAHAIHVTLKGFHQLTTREMIRRLQSQIDSQLPTLAAAGVLNCQESLTLDVASKPDMGCFVVAPHQKEDRKHWDDVTLDQALAVLGFDNLFRTVHYPPKITLDFLRKCQLEAISVLISRKNKLAVEIRRLHSEPRSDSFRALVNLFQRSSERLQLLHVLRFELPLG